MKEDKKVSIIIPIYNAEKYLSECLESVINQTYRNIEIIIINDGSQDHSKEICERYKNRDSRIKYWERENRGVSFTRNEGIRLASGEYIVFIDSDDYVANDYVDILVNNMNSCQMVACAYALKYKNKIKEIKSSKNIIEYTRREAIENLFSNKLYRGFLWNKIFDRKILLNNKIVFNEEISMCEDLMFVYNYIISCDKIVYTSKVGYYYRVRQNSISRNNSEKRWNNALKVYDTLLKEMYKKDENNVNLIKEFINLNINILINNRGKKNKQLQAIAKKNILENNKVIENIFSVNGKIKLGITLKMPIIIYIMKILKNYILFEKFYD